MQLSITEDGYLRCGYKVMLVNPDYPETDADLVLGGDLSLCMALDEIKSPPSDQLEVPCGLSAAKTKIPVGRNTFIILRYRHLNFQLMVIINVFSLPASGSPGRACCLEVKGLGRSLCFLSCCLPPGVTVGGLHMPFLNIRTTAHLCSLINASFKSIGSRKLKSRSAYKLGFPNNISGCSLELIGVSLNVAIFRTEIVQCKVALCGICYFVIIR